MQQMPYYPPGYQAPSPYTSSHLMQSDNGMSQLPHPVGVVEPNTPSPGSAQSAKRKQVKNACTNCQKACKKCDEARPCPRCVKYGISDTCVNSTRKERKKGVKRGPYKRRQKGDGDASTPEARTPRRKNSPEQPNQYDAQNIRASMPFSYPNGLNQYGQTYDAYSQYAGQPYIVNPVYSGMPYPQIVPGADGHGQGQQGQHQPYGGHQQMPHGQQHSPYNGYQGSPHQQSRSLQPIHGGDVKEEQKPHQPLTPVPSTSNSSAASSPHVNVGSAGANGIVGAGDENDEEGSRLARLSQLCRAALDQTDRPNATEST